MGKLSLALNFLGSLLPVVFPDKEFKPWRLFAVIVLLTVVGALVHFIGVDGTSSVIDLTGDAMRLTTE